MSNLFTEPFPLRTELLVEVSWNLRSECCSFPVGLFQVFTQDLFKVRCLECFYSINAITGGESGDAA